MLLMLAAWQQESQLSVGSLYHPLLLVQIVDGVIDKRNQVLRPASQTLQVPTHERFG
jgi:hypothetical protein